MVLTVVNNLGSAAQTYTVSIPGVGFPAGLEVVDVLSCRQVTVGSDGSLAAYFTGGLPMVSILCSACLIVDLYVCLLGTALALFRLLIDLPLRFQGTNIIDSSRTGLLSLLLPRWNGMVRSVSPVACSALAIYPCKT